MIEKEIDYCSYDYVHYVVLRFKTSCNSEWDKLLDQQCIYRYKNLE